MSKRTVTFRKPFVLDGLDGIQPAGAYCVETDEELLEGVSFCAYRRILTVIHLHAKPRHPGRTETLTIDPDELDAAITRDRSLAEMPVGLESGRKIFGGTADLRREAADRQALDRAEDEGMIIRPA